MKEPLFNDYALILSWPDATIRGDEKWMMFFKKIGIVKNLNFKVGHTGVVLVSGDTGEMLYYDFGRYICPRGYGRARSKDSDPRLMIGIKASFTATGKISNLSEICHYFEQMKSAMQGFGPLYFSVAEDINLQQAKCYADGLVEEGSTPYGAVAKDNNNCSRFITRLLIKSSQKYHHLHSINFPETIKASPISNIVNAVSNRMIYSFEPQTGLQHFKMNRWQSLAFLIKKLGENVNSQKAALLPEDISIGEMLLKQTPSQIPRSAQYLGGVGEGAWFDITLISETSLLIKRYTPTGELEYYVKGICEQALNMQAPLQITYDSHLLFTHIIQNNKKYKIQHVEHLELENNELPISTSLYA